MSLSIAILQSMTDLIGNYTQLGVVLSTDPIHVQLSPQIWLNFIDFLQARPCHM